MSDEKYLSRFSSIAALQYEDKIELSMFTQGEKAAGFIKKIRPDIVLAERRYFDEIAYLSEISELVCFTEEKDIQAWGGFRAVCKYQKFSDIYTTLQDYEIKPCRRNSDIKASIMLFDFIVVSMFCTKVAKNTCSRICLLRINRNSWALSPRYFAKSFS